MRFYARIPRFLLGSVLLLKALSPAMGSAKCQTLLLPDVSQTYLQFGWDPASSARLSEQLEVADGEAIQPNIPVFFEPSDAGYVL